MPAAGEATLLADLRDRPGDRGLRDVLADRWIERGDPRGAWVTAARLGDRSAERAARQRVLEATGVRVPPTRLRGEPGFVVEIGWDLVDFLPETSPGARTPPPEAVALTADPSLFATVADWHPLATVWLDLTIPAAGTEARTLQHFASAWAAIVPHLGRVRGLAVRVDEAQWPWVEALVRVVGPQVLRVTMRRGAFDAPDTPLSSVRDVQFEGLTAPRLDGWLDAVPHADRVAVRTGGLDVRDLPGVGSRLVDRFVESRRTWRSIDLRDAVLGEASERSLRTHLANGATIRHPSFDLSSPDPLDDPFGDTGDLIERTELTRRAAVCPGTETVPARWVQAEGRTMWWHRDDAPDARIGLPEPATALAGSPDAVVVGTEAGSVVRWQTSDVDQGHVLATVPGRVLELSVCEDRLAIRSDRGHGTFGPTLAWHDEPVSSVAMLTSGIAVARGSVLSLPDGTTHDFTDSITRIVADRGRIVLIAGTWVYRIEGGHIDPIGRAQLGTRRLTLARSTAAWTRRPGQVHLRRHDRLHTLVYPLGRGVQVADVAVHPDGTALIALEGLGANLILADRALALDPFPEDPAPSTWPFVFDAQVLIAAPSR